MSKQVFSERFEVQELIAEGGMGAVYKVLDIKLDRVVVLKVVHSHLSSDADFIDRFRDEARKTARLQGHPNIVQIFDVANDHGIEYLVMEYFPSTNLRDQLRTQGKFPLRDALDVTRQIAQALMKSHSCDIIHRDIKPANILLGSNQFVKLTDFGIAKALSDTHLTSTGQLIGTLKYMSPEQARHAILDGKSDLYSLGMVLYELVTGKNLWKDVPNLAIYGNLQAETTIPTLNFSSDIPQSMQAVIQDLLRFDPTDRIQNAEALISRLEDLREICEDSDTTIVRTRAQEPEDLEDKTVSVLDSPSSGPSGQKSAKPAKRMPPRPKKIALDGITKSTESIESKTTKTIRNIIFAAVILLVIGGLYYVNILPPKVDVDVEQNTDTVIKVIEDQKESQPLAPEKRQIPSINENQTASENVRVVQEKVISVTKSDENEAQRAQAKAAADAQAAEEARVAQAKAAATAKANEKVRIAQEKAAAQAQTAEKLRAKEAKAAAQEAEEMRFAEANAAAKAQAAEHARIAEAEAQVNAAEKARAAEAKVAAQAESAGKARVANAQAVEKVRLTETNAGAQAQAAEEVRAAKANATTKADAKAQAVEKARAAEEKAATQAKAAEKARIAEAKAVAAAQAMEKARIAKAKAAAQVKAAEEARVAEAKAVAQAKAAKKSRIAEAEKARIAKTKAATQVAETQALNVILAELQRSISKRDLPALKSMSTMSTSRQKMLENLFARYQIIETSIGDLTRTDDKTTVILQFTKFVRPNGEIVEPSRFLKTTNVVIPKDANGWGLLKW